MNAENPFSRIRTRGLVGWFLLGSIVIGILLAILKEIAPLDSAIQSDLIAIFLYFGALNWIYHKSKQGGIELGQFFQHGERIGVGHLLGLVITLVIFSIGATLVMGYLLAITWPKLLESTFLKPETAPSSLALLILHRALDILNIVVLAPVIEELLFRGIFLSRWATKWGIRKGILVSAAVFAVLHFQMLGAFVFGLCMAILYLRFRTLLVPIAAHAINNVIAVVMTLWGSSNSTKATVEDFRSAVWLGIVFLVIALPVLAMYVYRNWPQKDALSPYLFHLADLEASSLG